MSGSDQDQDQWHQHQPHQRTGLPFAPAPLRRPGLVGGVATQSASSPSSSADARRFANDAAGDDDEASRAAYEAMLLVAQIESGGSHAAMAPVNKPAENPAYLDPTDGTIYEWDGRAKAWFPRLDEAFIYSYQLSYGGNENAAAAAPSTTTEASTTRRTRADLESGGQQVATGNSAPNGSEMDAEAAHREYKRMRMEQHDDEDELVKPPAAAGPGRPGKGAPKAAAASKSQEGDAPAFKNSNVYVTGLPYDVDAEEFAEYMSQCGIIRFDMNTNELKVKVYTDANGVPKGDALCSYNRAESVQLALDFLDGSLFRGKHPIHVEAAKFSHKESSKEASKGGSASKGAKAAVAGAKGGAKEAGTSVQSDQAPPPQHHGPVINNAKQLKQVKARRQKVMQKLYGWDEFVPMENKRGASTVIISNVFSPEEFDDNPNELNELKEDMESECGKCGVVRKVTIFDRNPLGVVSVKFDLPEDAGKCVELMNGRWFGGRRLEAAKWDGRTSYKVEETDAQREARLQKWESWLLAQRASTEEREKLIRQDAARREAAARHADDDDDDDDDEESDDNGDDQ
ncbi:HIV TAT specific factor 1 [Capsaspora owczarzaki ATCC 30864]|uniref:HIV TAT specific factor 1 n=1 Tax=Capsaspora owczarzaki (strain ATCC 30864) TaxID=595528 RepID=A0A0D2WQS6_CAPO3|nr:HIV TAT specific factor 1 [Capsaspora owczarzaki ATCC 30864]KJE94075.1 HIV TAT specific factor 1 [Capsaspora owczarzaki ATCC 30864]|eukprot:XP_004347521.1 HIV TAT specific factor 1 [Capsaspora owczarzaki ATCC 30864]